MDNKSNIPKPIFPFVVPNHIPTSSEKLSSRIDLDKISEHANVFINHETKSVKIGFKRPPAPTDKNGNVLEETEEELLKEIERAYNYFVSTGRGDKVVKEEISVETRLGRFYSIKDGFNATFAH